MTRQMAAGFQQQYQQQQPEFEEHSPLDYAKIKQFLLHFEEEIKISATLQALRWRLTKTKRKQQVKLCIYAYQQYDLLGCSAEATQQL